MATFLVRSVIAALVIVLAPLAASPPAAAVQLTDFFGSYVGVAVVRDGADQVVEERHMDIEITPFRRGGFRIHWVNVSLIDGRRDVPGVTRRIAEVAFEPKARTDLFVEVTVGSVFQRGEELAPMAGDPVRWAKLDEEGLHVFSFVVLPDGGYELQIYTRYLTDVGLDLVFERVVDGETLRRIDGRTVRAN